MTVDELELELLAARQEVERIGQALAQVSHELKTPLTAIIAGCCTLKDEIHGPLSPAQARIVDTIARNGSTLLVVAGNLLDAARLQAGRMEITWQHVSLTECLETAYESVEPLLRAKGLSFSVELPSTPIFVAGSFTRLNQVFVNLLSNAVKFTEKGEIEVRAEAEGDFVVVHIRDTGSGIKPELLPGIFEEFNPGDPSLRRRLGGTGLGLAIARRIVKLHQGEIWAVSEPGVGTTVSVRLQQWVHPLAPR